MSGSGWHYVENEKQIGPLERSEVERLVSRGIVQAQTLVWQDGMDGWEEASRHFDIAGHTSEPPPIPSHRNTPSYGRQTASSGSAPLYEGAPARSFGEAISVCMRKYVTFSGRASRSEYWFFVLFNFMVAFVANLLDVALFGEDNELTPVASIANLALLLPSLAVAFRRLHDTNRSGWWIGGFWIAALVVGVLFSAIADVHEGGEVFLGVIVLAILIYAVVMLIFMCQRGDPGPNRYG